MMPVDFLRELIMLDPYKNDARILDVMIIWYVGRASGGLTYRELENLCDLNNGSIGRNVRRLGCINRKENAGYGLLDIAKDPREGRRYIVRLSTRGQKVYDKFFRRS